MQRTCGPIPWRQPLSPHGWAALGQTLAGCLAVMERPMGGHLGTAVPHQGHARSQAPPKEQPPDDICPPSAQAVSRGPAFRGRSTRPGPSGQRKADRTGLLVEAPACGRHLCESVRPTPAKLFSRSGKPVSWHGNVPRPKRDSPPRAGGSTSSVPESAAVPPHPGQLLLCFLPKVPSVVPTGEPRSSIV